LAYNIYSININVSDPGTSIKITDTKMIVEYELPKYAKEEYDVSWEKINKVDYISFNYNGNFMYAYTNYMGINVNSGFKKYLVIYGNNFIIFYNDQNKIEYKIDSTRTGTDELSCDVKASSELRESNILYSVENLLKMNNTIPWVEGVNGTGIGEKIQMQIKSTWRDSNIFYTILISNGFVDYNRPYLYENNNRIKKIRIKNIEDKNQWKDFEIQDTPNIQEIDISFLSAWNIEIEIIEVYQGTRYNDTCINFIIPIMFLKL